MEIIGTKRGNIADESVLQPFNIEGRPQNFPGTSDRLIIFGYDKGFYEDRIEEALIQCESLEDMRAYYDRKQGKTRIAWYQVVRPEHPALELAETDSAFDDSEIREEFEDLLD